MMFDADLDTQRNSLEHATVVSAVGAPVVASLPITEVFRLRWVHVCLHFTGNTLK